MVKNKKETKEVKKPGKAKKAKDSLLATSLAFTILFPMMYLMLPTVVFMFLSMLPTLVALIIDSSSRSRLKYKWLSIGGLNFAGTMPYLPRLWFGQNTWDGAVGLFLAGGSFLIIYLAAFAGWLMYRCIPPVVLAFVEMADQRRVSALREAQDRLISKWGKDVSAEADLKILKKKITMTDSSPKKP